jgi:hypothetical protein
MGMSQGYGQTDDDASLATLHRARELGVTFWDTAQSYGAGHNERLLARALKGHRDEVTLATKFGIVRDVGGVRLDGRPERVRSYCEESLARLGTDHIDLYYLHRVDPQVPVEETVGASALPGDLRMRRRAASDFLRPTWNGSRRSHRAPPGRETVTPSPPTAPAGPAPVSWHSTGRPITLQCW